MAALSMPPQSVSDEAQVSSTRRRAPSVRAAPPGAYLETSQGDPATTAAAGADDSLLRTRHPGRVDPDYLAISVLPDVDIRISARWGDDDLRPGKFKICSSHPANSDEGPPGSEGRRLTGREKLASSMLEELAQDLTHEFGPDQAMRGTLSPLGRVTVPMDVRPLAGIPDGKGKCGGKRIAEKAEYYCFIHPLNDQEMQEKIRSEINLAMNSWAFALLQGGYAYFNQDKKLIRVNAITLAPGAANSVGLILAGHEVPDAVVALHAMKDTKRLVDIREPDLLAAGFVAYGWIHAEENFHGSPATTKAPFINQKTHPYPDGAFLYEQKGTGEKPRIHLYPLMTVADLCYEDAKKNTTDDVEALMRGAGDELTEGTRTSSLARKDSLASAYSVAIKRAVMAKENSEAAAKKIEEFKRLKANTAATEQQQKEKENIICLMLKSNVGESLTKLIFYLAVGMLFYRNGGATITLDEGFGGESTWSYVEAFYFAVVTMSTVGYGDLTPESGLGQLFTAAYILFGVLIIFTECGELYDAFTACLTNLWNKLTKRLPDWMQQILDPTVYLTKGVELAQGTNDDEDGRELARCSKQRCCYCCMDRRKWHFFLLQLVLPIAGGFVICVIASAWIFTRTEMTAAECTASDANNEADSAACTAVTDLENENACNAVETTAVTFSTHRRACTYVAAKGIMYKNAVWHCWVTSTTVGYGDQICGGPGCDDADRATDLTLVFAAFHIIVAVSWLSSTATKVTNTITEWTNSEERHVWERKMRKLSLELLQKLDLTVPKRSRTCAEKGLDEVEFVVGMLIEQGATVNGQKLNYEEHVKPHRKRFKGFDGDKSGYLDETDMCHMVVGAEEDQRSSLRNIPILNDAISHARDADWDALEATMFPDGGYSGGGKCALSDELINTIPKSWSGKDRTYGLLHQIATWRTRKQGKNGETEFRKLVEAGVWFDTTMRTSDGLTCEEVARTTRPPNPEFCAVLEQYRISQAHHAEVHKMLDYAKKGSWKELQQLLFPGDSTECELSDDAINSKPLTKAGRKRDYGLLHQLASWASTNPGRGDVMMDGVEVHDWLVEKGVTFDYSLMTESGLTAHQVAWAQSPPNTKFVERLDGLGPPAPFPWELEPQPEPELETAASDRPQSELIGGDRVGRQMQP